eukprot:TRINITY_DN17160_c0_g1_i1.p1 TRINITY_DN17160_c0_g1~~TRINITY_DN17160_c0_g1_i1.p1  ORF type:complete len:183 (+),score=61.42 TRINITY_DN17160_c0_g1_i1:35-583(+)
MAEYKAVLLGSGGVGKSAIVIRFTQNNFVERYDPTIEDTYRKQFDVDGTAVVINIMDTAGQEEYSALRESYMKDGEGFVIVYDVTRPASFPVVSRFYQQAEKFSKKKGVPCVIVGNKSDLTTERAITTEEGKELAAKLGCKFMECSAKTNTNITELFVELLRGINVYRSAKPKEKKGGCVVL